MPVWVLALVAGVALSGSSLAGQAICSGPHGSPVLAQGGATLEPGTGWVQLSLYAQRSSEFFNTVGARQAFLSDGAVRTRSTFVTAAVGITWGLELWAQAPVHDVRFADQTGAREAAGLGDPRVAVRISPELITTRHIPVALRAGVKFPGRTFPVDATLIPLGEGQRDWEVSLQSSAVITGSSVYVLGWAGHRWRERNAAIDRKPGNEWFGHAAVGASWAGVRAELGTEVLWGGTPRQVGVPVPASQRRVWQLQPTIGRQVGPGVLDVTGFVPVVGRSLPSGSGVSIGYRVGWGSS
ncbi:MAG: hypothetical protein WD043_09365 [Gemmatimonadales bacterium]